MARRRRPRYDATGLPEALGSQRVRSTRRINRTLARHPVGYPILLIAVGALLVYLGFEVPVPIWLQFPFAIFGGCLLVFGLLLLLVEILRAILSPFHELYQRLTAPFSDPAIDELEAIYDGKVLGHEKGKSQMARTLVQRWRVSEEEARDIIDRLEAQGEIAFLPSGRWRVGPQEPES